MPQHTHELHPLCTLFPPLAEAEFDTLREDIAANGLRLPIVLLDGRILDGSNRYRACVEAGVEPTFTEFTGGNIVSFVLSSNLHRRHLSAGQQAAIVASAQDWAKAHVLGSNQHAAKGGGATLHLHPDGVPAPLPDQGLATVADRAAQSGASVRTQKMADKVAKADPALAKQVAHGEVSLPKAVAKVQGKPASEKPAPTAPAAADDGEPSGVDELLAELQAENRRLVEQVKAAGADDQVAETLKWQGCFRNAQSQQSEAMARAYAADRREGVTMRALMRCGKALGEQDPRDIAAKVEALVRAAREVIANKGVSLAPLVKALPPTDAGSQP
ncbi:hypothetical protein WMO32_01760 [Xanthomonas oryzae pv. oryzicola]|uniref:hypothetical protein n=1 Tax=Xanthomonas oryzae TaxID=347 RepID=UPI003132D2F7